MTTDTTTQDQQTTGSAGRTQATRAVEVATPLGKDVLLFYRMSAVEELGRLFRFELDLLCETHDIKFDDLLGQRMTVRLDLGEGKSRYFNGHVSSFTQAGSVGTLYCYHAVLRPWLWFLTLTSTCRIFQQKTIPDIITEVFGANGFTDYEKVLSGSYSTWEYCVQYRETDFNFVSRLMEREGIYYYFKHENDKHTMVLCDSVSSHSTTAGYEKVPFFPLTEGQQRERDHINVWSIYREVQPGACTLNDFDFKSPKANLNVRSAIKCSHVMSEMEVYDYPGEYVQTDDGEGYVRSRIEEFHSDEEKLNGIGDARGLCTGSLFELTGHTRTDQNREYLITASNHSMVGEEYGTSFGGAAGFFFSVAFTAVPSKQPFRPARITRKPFVQGPQTAIVVGPSGSEIYTDKYGRVKVHFHWDRYNDYSENASCWIRVAQVWAGAKWGAIHIPRIGQEVIVDFLEGDPDRPIITGRVYNADNMPPYDLPDNMTQSGVKSRSTKDGSPTDINELRFEDKKGEECIFIQAQKDKEIRIKNDRVEYVANESHFIVKVDQLEKVEGTKHLTVKGDHNEKVTGTISVQALADMQEKVTGKYALAAGTEIHLKAGTSLIIEAGSSISIKCGGSFINVGPAGVDIKGAMVNINSGGSAGSGSGSSPENPKEPREPGTSQAAQNETLPSPPTAPSPQAHTFKSAAVSGSPFCET